jgi:hypothetical protein
MRSSFCARHAQNRLTEAQLRAEYFQQAAAQARDEAAQQPDCEARKLQSHRTQQRLTSQRAACGPQRH